MGCGVLAALSHAVCSSISTWQADQWGRQERPNSGQESMNSLWTRHTLQWWVLSHRGLDRNTTGCTDKRKIIPLLEQLINFTYQKDNITINGWLSVRLCSNGATVGWHWVIGITHRFNICRERQKWFDSISHKLNFTPIFLQQPLDNKLEPEYFCWYIYSSMSNSSGVEVEAIKKWLYPKV